MIDRCSILQAGCAAAGLLALSMIWPAMAGSFQVNPVQIVLQPNKTTSSLIIRNVDRLPVSVRMLTYRWTQKGGDDVYTPTDDLIASPPIFTIPGNAKQLVRVGLRRRTPGAAYRVILEEIPGPSKVNVIQVALRINLPMYVLSTTGGKPSLHWSASRDASGEIVIEGRNDGTAHAQVTGIGLVDSHGLRVSLTRNMGVILPNSMRRWKIGRHPELRPGSDLKLSIRNSSGEDTIMARLETR